jgi:hypothetical protein
MCTLRCPNTILNSGFCTQSWYDTLNKMNTTGSLTLGWGGVETHLTRDCKKLFLLLEWHNKIELYVQLLARHKLNFQVPTFLALLLCNNTSVHHINTVTMGKIIINIYTNASTAVDVLIVTVILNIIQHTWKETI